MVKMRLTSVLRASKPKAAKSKSTKIAVKQSVPTKSKRKARVSPTARLATSSALARIMSSKPLHEVLKELIYEYGTYTIEERAIPAKFDGLKPSQRRVLWTMYMMGSRPDKNYIKAARITGAAMAYHPHGSTYDTLGNMIEGTTAPLAIGMGNWGSYSDLLPKAAERYTELKMSPFTMAMYFDPRFKNVYETVPNFDGSSYEPVNLPAQLPMALALDQSGIAVGVTAKLPTYTIESLYKAVKLALKAPEYLVPVKTLVKVLEHTCPYGGLLVSGDTDKTQIIKTGIGSVDWKCAYSMKGDDIFVTGFPPDWSFDSKMKAIRNIPEVAETADLTDNRSINIRIRFRKVSREAKDRAISKVIKLLQSKSHFKTNVTKRYLQKDELVDFSKAEFESISVQKLIADWVVQRLALEKLALQDELQELRGKLDHQNLMLLAVNSLDIIFKILKTKNIDKVKVLSRRLKITEEQSKTIWAIAVGRLDKLSHDEITATIKKLKSSIQTVQKRMKNLPASVEQHMEENKKALLTPIAFEDH